MEHRVLKIDPEFRDKIPSLTDEEFQKLEENIVADGEVRDPLVVWKDTIIDGHNRWKIIQKHPDIPYRIKEMEFADKWAAVVWMCHNQLGRRNVTDEQKTVLIGEAYKAQKMSNGGERGTCRDQTGKFAASPHFDDLRQTNRTAGKIAKQFNVGKATVERAEYFVDGLNAAEEVSPGFKNAILSGEVKAPKSTIAEIRKMEPEEKKKTVESILSGDPKKTPTKRVVFPKEARQVKQDIADIVADMYDSDSDYEYGVSDLVDEIKVNTEAFVKMLHRTTDIRREVFSGNERNKQEVISAINEYAIAEINRIVEVIKNA